jgi:hypothetical protein
MEQLIVVRPESQGKFLAQSLAIPELKAEAGTETEAIELVRQSLAAWLASARVVRVEVPTAAGSANPWLEHFGRFRDDPQFGDYLEEIQRARKVDDEG